MAKKKAKAGKKAAKKAKKSTAKSKSTKKKAKKTKKAKKATRATKPVKKVAKPAAKRIAKAPAAKPAARPAPKPMIAPAAPSLSSPGMYAPPPPPRPAPQSASLFDSGADDHEPDLDDFGADDEAPSTGDDLDDDDGPPPEPRAHSPPARAGVGTAGASSANAIGPGSPAPDFELPDESGHRVRLSDCRGRAVVVSFRPPAGGANDIRDACDFRDALGFFADLDTRVLWISSDSALQLRRMAQKYSLTFPLLSDAGAITAAKYGIDLQHGGSATFAIDDEGDITAVFQKPQPRGHVREVLTWLGEFAGAGCPA